MPTATETIFTMVTISKSITLKQIRGILCTATESPCGSWFSICGAKFPKGITRADFQDYNTGEGKKGRFCDPDDYWAPNQLIPTVEGCALCLAVEEAGSQDEFPNEWKSKTVNPDINYLLLTPEKIKKGIEVMAEHFPRHFNDWMEENDDAVTGDVFLQCCLFPAYVEQHKNVIFG